MDTLTLTGEQAAAIGALFGLGTMAMVIIGVLAVLFIIMVVVARWKIFKKAGQGGWKSLIPIYSGYVEWKIGWKNTALFWVALLLTVGGAFVGALDGSFVTDAAGELAYSGQVGIAGIIGSVMMLTSLIIDLVSNYKLFKSFGHGVIWTFLYILFPGIMLLVLGFGSSEYEGPQD